MAISKTKQKLIRDKAEALAATPEDAKRIAWEATEEAERITRDKRIANAEEYGSKRKSVAETKKLNRAHVAQGARAVQGDVWISDAINRAAHRLSLPEKRLVFLAAATMDYKGGAVPEITITAQDYADTFCVSINEGYRQLEAAGKALFDKKITWKSVSESGSIGTATLHWVQFAEYMPGEGRIKIQLAEKTALHMSMLAKTLEGYTRYPLEQVARLKSINSWRLLDLMMRFAEKGILRISVDDFCFRMDLPEKYLEDFGAIRKRVIDPALNELRLRLPVVCDVEKRGRKVDMLEFRFRQRAPELVIKEQEKPQL